MDKIVQTKKIIYIVNSANNTYCADWCVAYMYRSHCRRYRHNNIKYKKCP